jgi:hypothetical protein
VSRQEKIRQYDENMLQLIAERIPKHCELMEAKAQIELLEKLLSNAPVLTSLMRVFIGGESPLVLDSHSSSSTAKRLLQDIEFHTQRVVEEHVLPGMLETLKESLPALEEAARQEAAR